VSTARPALSATDRTVTGKKVAALRREGRLPAVVYGHGISSRPVSLDLHEFELLRRKTGPNALIDLSVGGKKATPVLIHGVGVDPVSRKPLHVDLFQVRMSEELTVDVPVVFTGESFAVAKLGGTLTHGVESLKVKALPDQLPQSFSISIEGLADFDAKLHVRDLEIPAGVTLLTDPGEVLAHVLAPRVEEAAAAAPTETAPGAAAGVSAAGEAETAGGSESAEG
jgi:large subunit ribosomal protein L25